MSHFHIAGTQIFYPETIIDYPSIPPSHSRHLYTHAEFPVFTHITIHNIKVIISIFLKNNLRRTCPVTQPFSGQRRFTGPCHLLAISYHILLLWACCYMKKRFGSIVTKKVTQYFVRFVTFLPPSFMPLVLICRTWRIEALHGNLIRSLRQIADFLIDFPFSPIPHF